MADTERVLRRMILIRSADIYTISCFGGVSVTLHVYGVGYSVWFSNN